MSSRPAKIKKPAKWHYHSEWSKGRCEACEDLEGQLTSFVYDVERNTRALAVATSRLSLAVAQAHEHGLPAERCAKKLGMSRRTFYRFVAKQLTLPEAEA